MKFKEMVQLNEQDRKTKMLELELELIKLNTQVATGTPPKNAGTVSRIKKDIARMKLANKLAPHKKVDAGKNKQPAKQQKQTASEFEKQELHKKAVKKVHTK